MKCTIKINFTFTLAGVAQWIECRPANQGVAHSIPSQCTCLGCRPGPQWGPHKGQSHIDVSLHFSLFPSLKINKIFKNFNFPFFNMLLENKITHVSHIARLGVSTACGPSPPGGVGGGGQRQGESQAHAAPHPVPTHTRRPLVLLLVVSLMTCPFPAPLLPPMHRSSKSRKRNTVPSGERAHGVLG